MDAVDVVDAVKLDKNDLLTKSMETCEIHVGDRVLRDEWDYHRIWRVGTVMAINEKSGKFKIRFDDLHIAPWRAKAGDPRPKLKRGHLPVIEKEYQRNEIYKAPAAPCAMRL